MLIRRNFLPDFMDSFFNTNLLDNYSKSEIGVSMPAVNITEESDKFTIEVAAPGIDKNDFKINLEQNLLTVSCEKETKNEETGERYTKREFNYSSFSRSFTLPENVEAEKIKAKHQNGILKIEVPKKEQAIEKTPRQIEIS